ncbi:SMI1/KNR4 family protein [Ideonella sp. A 288]|uniref:SMI1/KNR4 family protein n=1 Tax=Ideonella sp. A 288 TaxID=1962181 RepID=UPI0011868E39|nr:SMI1/KNR4 family protein [Ideonella sp. A 288]
MQVIWQLFLTYLNDRIPALTDTFRGVPTEEIAAFETKHRIKFPNIYVDFLSTMGEDSGPLYPFGDTQTHSFSELTEQFEDEDGAAALFFMVSYENDPSALGLMNKFIPLSAVGSDDAEMLECESGAEISMETCTTGLSFAETVISQAFRRIDVSPKRYSSLVFCKYESGGDGLTLKAEVDGLLSRLGFSSAVGAMARVSCLIKGQTSALIEMDDLTSFVTIRLSSDSIADVKNETPHLLRNIDGAELIKPPSAQHEETLE